MNHNTRHLYIPKLDLNVNLINAPELQSTFSTILRNWHLDVNSGLSKKSGVTFTRVDGGYLCAIKGTSLDRVSKGSCDAAIELNYQLPRWYPQAFPRHLYIHAAACGLGSGIILFPSTFMAGKSLLSVALARLGHRLFADDVVIADVDSNNVTALGILPRIRLPLPQGLKDVGIYTFINERQVVFSNKDAYIKIDDITLAEFAEHGPISGIVLLQRNEDCSKPQMSEVSAGEGLRALLMQNFTTSFPVRTIFDSFKRLATNVPIYRLRYSDALDAALALTYHFAKENG